MSTIGNVITLASFGVICYYIFREPLTLEGKRAYATLAEFPMFFGTVLFALEAIGVVCVLFSGISFERKRSKKSCLTLDKLNISMNLFYL